MQLSKFSRDSRLPCGIDKIVTNLRRRKLQTEGENKIGLAKNVLAIPLNRGFVLCAKDLVLYKARTVLLQARRQTNHFQQLCVRLL